jgi:alpha-amylase/alpha-mannosidase (GH57 family)
LHLVTPWPPVIELLATAERSDWSCELGTSDAKMKASLVGPNWLREYQFGSWPSLVPILLKSNAKIKISKSNL